MTESSGCFAADADGRTAYGIAAGLDETKLDGTQILIDANGWMRLRLLGDGTRSTVLTEKGGVAASWEEAATEILARPLAANAGEHRH